MYKPGHSVSTCIHVYMCINICVYIYIYIHMYIHVYISRFSEYGWRPHRILVAQQNLPRAFAVTPLSIPS